MAGTRLARRCQIFNGHQIAASHLVQTSVLDHFRRTEPRDLVILAGFGRFGETILSELQSRAAGNFDHVVIIDVDAERRAMVFDEQIGFTDDYRRDILSGDLRDPALWRSLAERVDLVEAEPVFVLGSGVDRTNLRTALWLAQKYPKAFVMARSEARWSFAEEVSREVGIHTFSVAELVTQSMPIEWFELKWACPRPCSDPGRRLQGADDLGVDQRPCHLYLDLDPAGTDRQRSEDDDLCASTDVVASRPLSDQLAAALLDDHPHADVTLLDDVDPRLVVVVDAIDPECVAAAVRFDELTAQPLCVAGAHELEVVAVDFEAVGILARADRAAKPPSMSGEGIVSSALIEGERVAIEQGTQGDIGPIDGAERDAGFEHRTLGRRLGVAAQGRQGGREACRGEERSGASA